MLAKVLKILIRIYSYAISPLTGKNCRYHPTCSAYAIEAIDRHGAIKGGILALRRIFRCHPWSKCAFCDPVPAAIDWAELIGYKRGHSSKEEKNHAKP